MEIGDRVQIKDSFFIEANKYNAYYAYYEKLRFGDTGFVITTNKLMHDWIGVEFDRNFGGHDCDEAGKNGHCLYIEKKYLILLPMIMKVKDWLREKNKPKEPIGQLFYLDIKYGENKKESPIHDYINELADKIKKQDEMST